MLVTAHPVGDHEHRRLAAETAFASGCLRWTRLLHRRIDHRIEAARIDTNRCLHVLQSHSTACLADVTRQTSCDRRDCGLVRAPPKTPLPHQSLPPQDCPRDKLAPRWSQHQTPADGSFATRRSRGTTHNSGSSDLCRITHTSATIRSPVFILRCQGGYELFSKKARRAECEHRNSVTVRNAGIERTVCEACGMVSLRGLEELSGSVSRNQFERESERSHAIAG